MSCVKSYVNSCLPLLMKVEDDQESEDSGEEEGEEEGTESDLVRLNTVA